MVYPRVELLDYLYIEKQPFFKMDTGGPGYRWGCRRCLGRSALIPPRVSDWDPTPTRVAESLRQHYEAVHRASGGVLGTQLLREFDNNLQRLAGGSYWAMPDFGTEEEKKEVTPVSRRITVMESLRRLEAEAARFAKLPTKDEYPVGTVITYEEVNGELTFTYAVLKAVEGKWYSTGQRGGPLSFEALIDILAMETTENIAVALPDDFKPLISEEKS